LVINSNQLFDLAKDWDISSIKFARSHRGTVWINDSLKMNFLGIPKAGNSGVRKHLSMDRIENIDTAPDYWTFTIIREPIERFVSAYIETMESCEQYPGGRFKHDLKLSRAKVKVLSKMSILDPLDKFESYLEKIVRWGFFEFHCVPQVIYLTNNFGTPHPNVEIYRLSDLKPLEEKLGTTFGKGNPSENPGLKQELLSYIWNHDDVRLQIEKLYELDMMVWQS
jgi:hypothetical protein